MAPKRTGREACERPNMTIPASSEEISWLVGRAATMGSRKSAVKTILDCLRERLSFNGAIATAALLFRKTLSGPPKTPILRTFPWVSLLLLPSCAQLRASLQESAGCGRYRLGQLNHFTCRIRSCSAKSY